MRVTVSPPLYPQHAESSSLHARCILKVTDLIAHMSTSTRPSSSAAKPAERQKTDADTAMLAGGVTKPTAPTTIDNASELSSGVAKPTVTKDLEPSVLLQILTDMLSCRAQEAGVKKLLSDTAKLREWQTAAHPTHKQRDAMTKLGSDWHVPQKSHGKKRGPVEVAKDLEKEFINTAKRLLENRTPFGHTRGTAKSAHGDRAAPRFEAPTNKAARVINGRTIHNVFQLPDSSGRTSAVPPSENDCAPLEQ